MNNISEDEKLVEEYLQGNEEALEILIKKYLKMVFSFIFRMVENYEDAKDLTQETFIKAWKNLKKFDSHKSSFKTWLFIIAKNTTFDFLRKRKEILFSEIDENFEKFIIDKDNSPQKIYEKKELKEILELALNKLPLKYRMVLILHYNDHLTFREIAEILDESINTIKSRHQRAIKLLRKLLTQYFLFNDSQ